MQAGPVSATPDFDDYAAGQSSRPQEGSQTAIQDGPDAAELKAVLLDSLYGTDRGMSASAELRGEISELISQLEAANPNKNDPNDAQLLGGTWKLVYTAASELGALLALGRLPFVTVGDITQTIEVASGTVVNKVVLSDVFTRSAFSSTANFEVRSPKLLSVKFVSGALATPQLLQDIDLPPSISVLGQNVDLTMLREALSPARSSVQAAVSQVSAFLEGRPDTSFKIPKQVQAESWLLTTYIDEDVRIARGDGGAVFVLVKEQQPLGTSANGGFGSYGTGAWKDDPIGNRPASAATQGPPLTAAPLDTPPLSSPMGRMTPPSTGPPFNSPIQEVVPSAQPPSNRAAPVVPPTAPVVPPTALPLVRPSPTTGSPKAAPSVESIDPDLPVITSIKPSPTLESITPRKEPSSLPASPQKQKGPPPPTPQKSSSSKPVTTKSQISSRTIVPTSLTTGGGGSRPDDPGLVLGTSLGQRKANKAKKAGTAKPRTPKPKA